MPIAVGTERILFVDDEQDLIDIARQVLERWGYTVTSATDSITALEMIRRQPDSFDLLVTDMTMPHLTGEQLAREALKVRPDLPIILCTGFSHRITEEKARRIGIKRFVMKPIVVRELALAVRETLDGSCKEA